MAVVQALRQSPGVLIRTPALVVPMLILFLLDIPQLVLQTTNPLLASMVSMGFSVLLFVFIPFFQGGMVGMADEARVGESSVCAFLAHGTANFLQLFIAYLLVTVVYVILGGILFAVIFGALLTGVLEGSTLVLVGLGLLATLFVFVMLLISFLIQFHVQAIVLEEYTVIEGLKRSYRVVRSNLRATVGYTAVAIVVGSVLGVVFGVLGLLTTPEAATSLGVPVLSIGGLIGVGLVATLIAAVISAFLYVYSVCFYRLITQ